jgi:hypothetical protein
MRKFSLPAGLLVLYAAASIPAAADKGGARFDPRERLLSSIMTTRNKIRGF